MAVGSYGDAGAATKTKALQPASEAAAAIGKVLSQIETDDGWVALSIVGKQLANLSPDFDSRTYGFRKLNDLVRETRAFEVDHPEGRPVRIRNRQSDGKLKGRKG